MSLSHLRIMNISFPNGYCCFLWNHLLAVYFEHEVKSKPTKTFAKKKVFPTKHEIKIDKTRFHFKLGLDTKNIELEIAVEGPIQLVFNFLI